MNISITDHVGGEPIGTVVVHSGSAGRVPRLGATAGTGGRTASSAHWARPRAPADLSVPARRSDTGAGTGAGRGGPRKNGPGSRPYAVKPPRIDARGHRLTVTVGTTMLSLCYSTCGEGMAAHPTSSHSSDHNRARYSARNDVESNRLGRGRNRGDTLLALWCTPCLDSSSHRVDGWTGRVRVEAARAVAPLLWVFLLICVRRSYWRRGSTDLPTLKVLCGRVYLSYAGRGSSLEPSGMVLRRPRASGARCREDAVTGIRLIDRSVPRLSRRTR